MAKTVQPSWDYSWIVPGKLIQGGYPEPPPSALSVCDTLVLTAEEAQPRIATPPKKLVLRLPLDDDFYRPLPREVGTMAIQLATQLAKEICAGRVVAVTCWQGVNRSGLITGLTLMQLYGCTGRQAVNIVRAKRKPTATDNTPLSNPMFEQFLTALR
jgi:protein-tyrosine phosphatase